MEMVILKSFDNYISASILLSRLQSEGIACALRDEHTSTIFPVLGNAIGGIKLEVAIEDESKARILLKTFEEEYLKSVACPRCHAHDILNVPKKAAGNLVTAFLTWLFSSYAVAPEMVYQCQQCGFETTELPENPTPFN
jgi:hypothetical protein